MPHLWPPSWRSHLDNQYVEAYGFAHGREHHGRNPGHARHAYPEDAEPGADAWLRHCAARRADFQGRIQDQSRIAAYGAAAPRAFWMARFRVAADRKLAPRQVLFAYAHGEEAAGV